MTFFYNHSPLGLSKEKSNLPFVIKFSLANHISPYHLTAYSYSCSFLFSLFFSHIFGPKISHGVFHKNTSKRAWRVSYL